MSSIKHYSTFAEVLDELKRRFSRAHKVAPQNWQGMDVRNKPEMRTRELLNVSFTVPMPGGHASAARDIQPNLPWADDHFLERVGGEPLNPGVQWANWPFAKSAARFLAEQGGKFTHTYMERFWPKRAGIVGEESIIRQNLGLRYDLGDLNDVLDLLERDQDTRQAYLPIFFPEDTGAVHGGRIPCTIGYHFIHRFGYLHCVYQLRSCDYVRHLRDDIYLAYRLAAWVQYQLAVVRKLEAWKPVRLGTLTMHITSLHIFEADVRPLLGAPSE